MKYKHPKFISKWNAGLTEKMRVFFLMNRNRRNTQTFSASIYKSAITYTVLSDQRSEYT